MTLTFRESPLLSIFELKNLLQTWTKQRIQPLSEIRSGETIELRVQLTHSELRTADAISWTFGLITDGKREDNVIAFVKSIYAIHGLDDFEILICGPEIEELSEMNVLFIKTPDEFDHLGWITKKKNLIARKSSKQNLLIAHDRYVLPENFLEKMIGYGGDFDVISPRQVTPDGKRFPDWVCTGANWSWSPSGMLDYDDYSPYNYVNGGLTLAKTALMKRVGWNELLFWGQAEDVELSRRLLQDGAIHRPFTQLVISTLEARLNYDDAFMKIPVSKKSFILPFRKGTLPFSLFDGASIRAVGPSNSALGYALVVLMKKFGFAKHLRSKIEALKPQLIRAKRDIHRLSPRTAVWLENRIRALQSCGRD